MTAKILCRVLVNGQPCGYEPPADLKPKDRLIDLFRHQDQHKAHATTDEKGRLVVTNGEATPIALADQYDSTITMDGQ